GGGRRRHAPDAEALQARPVRDRPDLQLRWPALGRPLDGRQADHAEPARHVLSVLRHGQAAGHRVRVAPLEHSHPAGAARRERRLPDGRAQAGEVLTCAFRRTAALSLLVFLLAASGPAQEATPAADAPTVVSLSFVSDGVVDEAEVTNLVTIRVGAPLTPEETGGTIRNLFETGLFADIGVEAETVEGGVAVVLRLSRAFRVFPLKFSGVPLPREE